MMEKETGILSLQGSGTRREISFLSYDKPFRYLLTVMPSLSESLPLSCFPCPDDIAAHLFWRGKACILFLCCIGHGRKNPFGFLFFQGQRAFRKTRRTPLNLHKRRKDGVMLSDEGAGRDPDYRGYACTACFLPYRRIHHMTRPEAAFSGQLRIMLSDSPENLRRTPCGKTAPGGECFLKESCRKRFD